MDIIKSETISVAECAKIVGVSRPHLYPYITSGDLPSILLGNRRLVRRETLMQWLASKEKKAA